MNHQDWDWQAGKKIIADLGDWKQRFGDLWELCAGPDGETAAAIVASGDGTFSICENGELWDTPYDKIWHLRFGGGRRPSALVSADGVWTVASAGVSWDNWFEFVWNPLFIRDNGICAAARNGQSYMAVLNDIPWENGFNALTHLTTDKNGNHSTAVVQTVTFSEGDIITFQKGCYSVAVNGIPWPNNYLNAWEPTFCPQGQRVAAEVRKTLYDYTIAVDGVDWDQRFTSVWKPVFHPIDGSVTAPVRMADGWALARNGHILWDERFIQLWHHAYTMDGARIAAIACPKFGKWTIAVDGKCWPIVFSDLVTDMVISPDGNRIACVGKSNGKWHIAVDGKIWEKSFDMAWQPVFSPDSRHVAAKVEYNGRTAVVVDGDMASDDFRSVEIPVFGPDSDKILIRGIDAGGRLCRFVSRLSDISRAA